MGWSPEQIAGRLMLAQGKSVISHESIYRYIYWRVRPFNENLHLLLPRHKRRRGRQRRKKGLWMTHGAMSDISSALSSQTNAQTISKMPDTIPLNNETL